MKKYTNEERFEALNRHYKTMHVDDNGIFTTFTQRCEFTSFEDFADLIITNENFYKEYGYERFSFFPDRNTCLYNKQYEIFQKENRKLTEEETNVANKEDDNLRELYKRIRKGELM